MISTRTARREALIALAQIAEPFDGCRTHVLKLEGKPERFVIWQTLPIQFTNIARQARDRMDA